MSKFVGKYTDSDNIKAHLQSSEVEIPNVIDSKLELTGLDDCQLPNNNITGASEVVKIIRSETLLNATALLVGTIPVAVTPYLVRGSIHVTDTTGATYYVENRDFIIDYATGTIERASTGSTIPSGSTVIVWRLAYDVLIRNTDYRISYDAGTIARIAGTSIPDGATVYVDYSHGQSTITDDLIKRAIIEAEEFMSDKMSNTAATGEGLTMAANYYALSIIALSQAAKELKSRSNNSDDLAKVWNTLQESYLSRAIVAFKPFANTGDLNPGGVMQNRYSRERSISRTSPSVTPGYRSR
jgi:hypothetical protein